MKSTVLTLDRETARSIETPEPRPRVHAGHSHAPGESPTLDEALCEQLATILLAELAPEPCCPVQERLPRGDGVRMIRQLVEEASRERGQFIVDVINFVRVHSHGQIKIRPIIKALPAAPTDSPVHASARRRLYGFSAESRAHGRRIYRLVADPSYPLVIESPSPSTP